MCSGDDERGWAGYIYLGLRKKSLSKDVGIAMNVIRSLMTTSLVLSLSISGLHPRLTSAMRNVRPIQRSNVCCCGTTDGNCCGMTCCQMPNPDQKSSTKLPNGLDDRVQPLGLIGATTTIAISRARAIHRQTRFEFGGGARPSLIALSVRLNT